MIQYPPLVIAAYTEIFRVLVAGVVTLAGVPFKDRAFLDLVDN